MNVEVYIMSQPKNEDAHIVAYYEDPVLSDVILDLKANQYEIKNIEYAKVGSLHRFFFNVD